MWQLEDRLTCIFASVDADVEACDQCIQRFYIRLHLFKHRLNGIALGLVEIKEARDMSFGNDQRVMFSNGILVTDRIAKFI